MSAIDKMEQEIRAEIRASNIGNEPNFKLKEVLGRLLDEARRLCAEEKSGDQGLREGLQQLHEWAYNQIGGGLVTAEAVDQCKLFQKKIMAILSRHPTPKEAPAQKDAEASVWEQINGSADVYHLICSHLRITADGKRENCEYNLAVDDIADACMIALGKTPSPAPVKETPELPPQRSLTTEEAAGIGKMVMDDFRAEKPEILCPACDFEGEAAVGGGCPSCGSEQGKQRYKAPTPEEATGDDGLLGKLQRLVDQKDAFKEPCWETWAEVLQGIIWDYAPIQEILSRYRPAPSRTGELVKRVKDWAAEYLPDTEGHAYPALKKILRDYEGGA